MASSIGTHDTESLSSADDEDGRRRRTEEQPATPTTITTTARPPSRDRTPSARRQRRAAYESLVTRPRSNPRTRTPMRYESPLNANVFRRETVVQEAVVAEPDATAPVEMVHEARRVTIRPMAGQPVGVVVRAERRHRTTETREPSRRTTAQKSRKQGPSKRKTRRWNNDNFSNIASEFDTTSRGKKAAEIIARAKESAHHYRPIYDPQEARSDVFSRFMEKKELRPVRDQFFRGELHPPTVSKTVVKEDINKDTLDGHGLFHLIDARLRNVVAKACENSEPACQVVQSFEKFLVSSFLPEDENDPVLVDVTDDCHGIPYPSDFWKGILLQEPKVTRLDKKHAPPEKVGHFYFDGDSPSGGFHRLLFHAVCQFHGLKAVSSTVKLQREERESEQGDWSVVQPVSTNMEDSFLLVDGGSDQMSSMRSLSIHDSKKNIENARLLKVTGKLVGSKHSLLENLSTQ